jgi:hypothetical protein
VDERVNGRVLPPDARLEAALKARGAAFVGVDD